jgi:NADH dehydrogenase
MARTSTQVVILGGGFAGVYVARRLLQLAKRDDGPDSIGLQVHLVNRENYMVFQPMLAEVLGGSVGVADTVTPLRRLMPGAKLYIRDVESVDLAAKTVTCAPGFRPRPLVLPYDHLVLALGSVTDFRGMRGLAEHAFAFKTLGDALAIRNHALRVLEEAAAESDSDFRQELLTFVVGGGGFSGVEAMAELHDFVRRSISSYGIDPIDCRFILLHSRDRILPELDPELGEWAGRLLQQRGVEIRFNSRLAAATANEAILADGSRIRTRTLISTVPAHPNPVIDALQLPKDGGKLVADGTCRVKDSDHVWALGDCALIPLPPTGKEGDKPRFAPPTAQHAIREATVCADNIVAVAKGRPTRAFDFGGLGSLAALGHQKGVGQVFGVKISGLLAWFVWRSVYWAKLPGIYTRMRVGLSWLLHLLFPPDLTQLKLAPTSGIHQEHFEPGQTVFEQGDLGDRVYIVIKGKAQVTRHAAPGQSEQIIAELGPGQYFGEMALMHRAPRNATVRCIEAMDVLSIAKGEFQALVSHLDELRAGFERTATLRREG